MPHSQLLHSQRSPARYLRAAAALVVLLVLVVGLPVGLAATVGNPLQAWPDLRAGDLSDTAVVAVLAAVAWVAWAQFAVAVLAETLSVLAGIRLPARLPGLFPSQRHLAHLLVVAAFVIAPLHLGAPPSAASSSARGAAARPTAVATAPATFVAADPAEQTGPRGTGAGQAVETRQAATRQAVYTVSDDGPGTYWDLAERFLGDGLRWQEIWDLNSGRRQSDGAVMTSPDLLRPGWTVTLPAGADLPPGDEAVTTPGSDDSTGTAGTRDTPDTASDEVTVRRGDTLSGIAVEHDVADWHRLWQENQNSPQPGGRTFTDPDLILPGWTIDLPAAQPTAGRPSTPIQKPAPTNDGRQSTAQPDPSTSPPSAQAPTVAPTAAPTAGTEAAPETAPNPATRADDTDRGRGAAASTTTGAGAPQATPPPDTTTVTAGEESSADAEAPAGDFSLAATLFGAGGLLLAGVSAEALRRHRRRQQRHRRLGRAIAATPPQLSGTERAVTTGAGVADVRWLNEALRGLVHLQTPGPDSPPDGSPDASAAGTEPRGSLPDVVAARLSATELELVLAEPRPQAPGAWTVHAAGTRWTLDRGAPTGFDPAAAGRLLAPYPALASVGYTAGGEYWLLDLERAGSVALTGDPARCLDLARFIAAELAHNTWSEQLAVTLAGFGDEIADLNPDRVTVTTDPAAAVTRSLTQLRNVAWALKSAGIDVLTGRLRDVAADLLFPQVVLLADLHDPDLLEELAPLLAAVHGGRDTGRSDGPGDGPGDGRDCGGHRTAAAVVLTGRYLPTSDAAWQLRIDADGALHIPALGLDLVAQQLPAHEAAQLAQLLTVAARTDDRPMPDAPGDAGWQGYADLAGAPRHDMLTDAVTATDPGPAGAANVERTARQAGDATTGSVRPDRVLPLPPAAYLESTATTCDDLTTLAPAVDDTARRRVGDADPSLDTDLADWRAQDCPRPRLTVLGPLTVRAGVDLPTEKHRRAWTTEVVAYLACHPRGVTAEQLGEDLWPTDPRATTTSKVRQAIYMVRKRLGTDPTTGTDYVPTAINPTGGPGLYRIDGLLVDADLFRRLRLRGVARGADGITDLQAALDLVTGPPFADRRPSGYAWLADDPLDHTYTGMIVDVAHVVATHHLATGRPDLAAAAAQVALAAGSTDDVALLDLVAACDAQGNRAQADRLVARILANHDAEVEEDLPPRTAEVLHRRRWLDRAG
ncbi:LysM peptidoglycan-binding domain-containing protein [Kineosporia sp. A_224]|uniref:LysM peptidoglycan-binding domain-containing protein n=1 Tax=Kineosporia sp. A_224 TaxID=1962180 RepID=UPI000B4A935B|nr:LysM peptidoglycan-binding domain-containing protein [Kineosporia sp. A_224]